MVASQRLADPLAVGVAAAALGAAHALVVQHGVDVHVALLALEASLKGDSGRSACAPCLRGFLSRDGASLRRCAGGSFFKPIKNGFLRRDDEEEEAGDVWCGFLLSNIFFLYVLLAVHPPLWLSDACCRGWRGCLECEERGISRKWGPSIGGEVGGCMYGSLCIYAQQGKRATGEEEGGVLWNYSYCLNAERKALDSRTQKVRAQKTHPRIHSDSQRQSRAPPP